MMGRNRQAATCRQPHRRLAGLLGLCLAGLALLPSAASASVAAVSAEGGATLSGRAESGREWIFQPLGPEGAEIAELVAVGDRRWAARSREGELYLWESPGGDVAGGAWEAHRLPGDGTRPAARALRLAAAGARFFVLTSIGELLAWTAGEPEFTRLGTLPPEVAGGAVALLPPGEEPGAPGSDLACGIVVTRGGTMIRLHAGRPSIWEPRFAGFPGTRAAAERPAKGRRPTVRGAWRVGCDAETFLALVDWEGLFISHDGGRSFAPVAGDLPKAVRALTDCAADSRRWFALAGGGLYRSDDCGRSWHPQGSAAPPGAGDDLAAAVALAAPDESGEVLLALTPAGTLLRSPDGGMSWERPLPEIHSRGLALAAGPAAVKVGTSRGVLASDDLGAAWCWSNRGLRGLSVLAIGILADPATAAGGEAPRLAVDTDLGSFVSADRGLHWEPAAEPLAAAAPPATTAPRLLAAAPFARERIVEIAESPLGAHWVFVRTVDGLFASADAGASWEGVPLPGDLTVTSMALDLDAGELLVGTARYGLFTAELPAERLASDLPLPVHASPNPFAESVILRCELPPGVLATGEAPAGQGTGVVRAADSSALGVEGEAAAAVVTIFSVHGQLIRRLAAPAVVAGVSGETRLLWDWNGLDERGQPVPSGMYLVSATAGSQRFIGKIIKLR
jgi:photosystem II stability/assembly factor-like uncharacterized protein